MGTKTGYQDDVTALSDVLDALSKLEPTAQQWVLNTAAQRLQLSVNSGQQPSPSGSATTAPELPAGSVGKTAPKEFLRLKAPKSDVDRVACVAFYLTHGRQTASYASRELSAINTEAAGPKMNMSRAVDNATKQSGYLTSAGKGKKQITALGEDVVQALPDYEKVGAVLLAGKAKARRRRAKKKKTA